MLSISSSPAGKKKKKCELFIGSDNYFNTLTTNMQQISGEAKYLCHQSPFTINHWIVRFYHLPGEKNGNLTVQELNPNAME